MKKIIAMALALVMLFAIVSCGAETDTKSEGVMTYAEYDAAALDSEVVIEAYVQNKQIYAEAYGNTSLYLQDKEGAYFVYRWACTAEEYAKLTAGTKVKVTGYKSAWSGEVEITDAKVEVIDGKTYVAKPVDVTSKLGTDELIMLQNQFVSFKDMTVAASTDSEGKEVAFLYKYNGTGSDGDDLYFNVSLGDATYNFTVESDLCAAGTSVYETVKTLKVGDKIDLEGFLYWYNGANPHITSVTVK